MRIGRTALATTIAVGVAVPALLLAAACGGSDDQVVEVTGTASCIDVVDGASTGDGMDFRDAGYYGARALVDGVNPMQHARSA